MARDPARSVAKRSSALTYGTRYALRGGASELRSFAARVCASCVEEAELKLFALNHSPWPAGPRTDLLKLTSGTTAEPRAIRFTAAQLLADCDNICDTMGLREDDRNYGIDFLRPFLWVQQSDHAACSAAGFRLLRRPTSCPGRSLMDLGSAAQPCFPECLPFFERLAEVPGRRECASLVHFGRCAAHEGGGPEISGKLGTARSTPYMAPPSAEEFATISMTRQTFRQVTWVHP